MNEKEKIDQFLTKFNGISKATWVKTRRRSRKMRGLSTTVIEEKTPYHKNKEIRQGGEGNEIQECHGL